MSEKHRNRDLSTGEVAKICKVVPVTVLEWFSAGLLKGYYVPGSQTRRIPRSSLEDFLKKYNRVTDENEMLFLTGEVGEICLVSSQSIRRYYDKELLGGNRNPKINDRGASKNYLEGFRIISGSSLISFITEHCTPSSLFFSRLFNFIEEKRKPKQVAHMIIKNKGVFPFDKSVHYFNFHKTEIIESYSARFIGRYLLFGGDPENEHFRELSDYVINALR